MNFYQETPEDRQRKKEALEKQIQEAVHRNQSSFKEWLVKPVVVATITAVITTAITVPITIVLTKFTNEFADSHSQVKAEKTIDQKGGNP